MSLLIHPYRFRNCEGIEESLSKLPTTNPIVYDIDIKGEIGEMHNNVYSKYKRIEDLLGWLCNGNSSSTQGYSTYTDRFTINVQEINQHLTLVRSPVLKGEIGEMHNNVYSKYILMGSTVGIKWSINIVEWYSYGGIINSENIDSIERLKEYIIQNVNITKMYNSPTEKKFAEEILINQLHGNRNID